MYRRTPFEGDGWAHAHPLQQAQSLLTQQLAVPQLADCALQAQQLVQVPPVPLLQHLHFLLQLCHDDLQLLLTQAVLVVADQETKSRALTVHLMVKCYPVTVWPEWARPGFQCLPVLIQLFPLVLCTILSLFLPLPLHLSL